MSSFSFHLYTPLLAPPIDGWDMTRLVTQFAAYCKAVESQIPNDSERAGERLQVYASHEQDTWSLSICGEQSGTVIGNIMLPMASKEWPVDLLAARLRLALNGMPSTSLEELSAYHDLFEISDFDH